MTDQIHMCIEIPPKHSVATVIGFIKGKSAIAIARQFGVAIATSPVSTSGLVAMRFRPLALSWNKAGPTFVIKKQLMTKAGFRPPE